MHPPCELVVKHVLPVMRAMIAKELIETHNFTQTQAAEKLGITQAAISWYLSQKRGHEDKKGYRVRVEKIQEVGKKVKEIANFVAGGKVPSVEAILNLCEACVLIRSSREFCQLHMTDIGSLDFKCDICVSQDNVCSHPAKP
ncbi:hypothetical protein [Candidatus Hecatella orcuttiae]|jgi:hypothetical protein|uniref:transcriptional regulator n=1 Tax=Candidatus Hecatella orcuttiae TaxID=1935119 RepID=UPI0028681F98|nr:hypothetical protein [Candidatus Hecatella orcuttiae]